MAVKAKINPKQIIESIILEQGLKFEKEFRFAIPRRWKFDWRVYDPNNPFLRCGIEFEGGTWVNGGHNRGKIYADNCEKYNAAACMGWTVLRYTTDMVQNQPRLIEKDLQYVKERGKK